MRTALVLLFVLAAGSVFGSLFPQRPISPARVEQFLSDNPGVGPVLDRLGMFDVFGSPWYTAIYLALMTAVIACLVPRGLAHLRVLRSRPPRGGAHLDRYRNTATIDLTVPPGEATAAVHKLLAGRRYRVAAHGPGELAAEKGYLREAGSVVFHLSILVLLVGLGFGKGDGFRGQMVLVEGEQKANTRLNYDVFVPGRFFSAGNLPPFRLGLEDFTNSFHPNGVPAGYSSQVVAVGADGHVQRQRVAVNHPLTVDGVRVFQSDYGYAPLLEVTAADGTALYDGPVQLLRDPDTEISSGALKLTSPRPQLGLELTFFTDLHTPAQAGGGFGLVNRPQLANPVLVVWPWQGDLRASQAASVFTLDVSRMDRVGDRPIVLRPGQRAELPGGLKIAMPAVRQYTVLTLARDPGVPLVAVGAALLLAGLLPSLYVRRRRVWARVSPDGAGGSRIQLAGLALQGKPAFAEEFAALAERVRASFPSPPPAPGPSITPSHTGED
jgi:cytochrome c biogenesis protein